MALDEDANAALQSCQLTRNTAAVCHGLANTT